MSITAELAFLCCLCEEVLEKNNKHFKKLFYAGKCLFLIRHIPWGNFYSLSVTPEFIQMSQSYAR